MIVYWHGATSGEDGGPRNAEIDIDPRHRWDPDAHHATTAHATSNLRGHQTVSGSRTSRTEQRDLGDDADGSRSTSIVRQRRYRWAGHRRGLRTGPSIAFLATDCSSGRRHADAARGPGPGSRRRGTVAAPACGCRDRPQRPIVVDRARRSSSTATDDVGSRPEMPRSPVPERGPGFGLPAASEARRVTRARPTRSSPRAPRAACPGARSRRRART